MNKYRAPDLEPPLPVVDQWLMDISAEVLASLPAVTPIALVLTSFAWLAWLARRRAAGDKGQSHKDAEHGHVASHAKTSRRPREAQGPS